MAEETFTTCRSHECKRVRAEMQAEIERLRGIAKAVEDAPYGRVPKAKVGDLLLFPVSHDFAGKKVKLVEVPNGCS